MREFIVKYWLEFLFGGVITILGGVLRHFYKLLKQEKENKQQDELDVLYDKIVVLIDEKISPLVEKDKALNEKIEELTVELKSLKKGLLSLQGRKFKEECHALLDQKEPITTAQFEHIQAEHHTYNQLDGNHDGDELYNSVIKKYQSAL